MFGIGKFFERIQNSYTKEIFVRSTIIDALKKIVNIDVSIKDISIKGDTLSISGISQSARSVIYIKKESIMKEINGIQKIKQINNIR